jgi:hypothetical protein
MEIIPMLHQVIHYLMVRVRNIYGATKIYDTRVGYAPLFPEELLNDKELFSIITEEKNMEQPQVELERRTG